PEPRQEVGETPPPDTERTPFVVVPVGTAVGAESIDTGAAAEDARLFVALVDRCLAVRALGEVGREAWPEVRGHHVRTARVARTDLRRHVGGNVATGLDQRDA